MAATLENTAENKMKNLANQLSALSSEIRSEIREAASESATIRRMKLQRIARQHGLEGHHWEMYNHVMIDDFVIKTDDENLNYWVIENSGRFVNNETGKKQMFNTRRNAQDVYEGLKNGNGAYSSIFSIK